MVWSCFPVAVVLTDVGYSRLSGREDETTFLDRLELLWKGFVNMPSVAKFVTKAHPVSGVLDHLTEVSHTSHLHIVGDAAF